MWGDPERALKLEAADPQAALLFQITGPAHVPHHDPRWQELFHAHDIWVHVEFGKDTVIEQAATSMATHASRTSNLSSFAMHVSRMIRELIAYNDKRSDFATKMTIINKSKTVAGALNLLRILVHAVIVKVSQPGNETDIDEVFLYQSRDATHLQATGHELMDALATLIATASLDDSTPPEFYDSMVLAMELFIVLLSSQLYQPMISSFERSTPPTYFWETLRKLAESADTRWETKELLQSCLDWTTDRPVAPARSIAHHNSQLAQSVVQAKGEKMGPDGMYESHLVVFSSAPSGTKTESSESTVSKAKNPVSHNIFFDATKGVLVFSSSIILLPFRLMSLALGLWGNKEKGYDEAHRKQLQSHFQSNRTKDTLWLSDSPISDLAASILLLLLNSERVDDNPFRDEMKRLADNRWDTEGILPNLPGPFSPGGASEESDDSVPQLGSPATVKSGLLSDGLGTNFEELFDYFARTAHNEMGALLLYTVCQASPSFAETVAVRSDLDRVVLPLLRTFYYSSSLQHYAAQDYSSRAKRRPSNYSYISTNALSIRNCPFRSQSQLYVIVILLLIFSQDPSFGSDAFRRINITRLSWYKERNLRDISLGSVLILTLLRMLSFNLKRLHDAFLLSNCCAVFMNLSTSIVEVHDYAAMRLVSTAVSTMKRYATLYAENGKKDSDDIGTPLGMYSEVTRTLLRVLKDCFSAKNIEHNLHLVYAMIYHQTDFKRQVNASGAPFKKSETGRILKVIETAGKILDESGDARTAAKALSVLSEKMSRLKEVVAERRKRSENEDYTFTYEEESDPEIFFVPYVWEVVVCAVTSSAIEWQKNSIKVFPLLDEETVDIQPNADSNEPATVGVFSKDVNDVV